MKGFINKKTVGGAFLIVLILLVFFSKTIYTYNLPEVTAVAPQNGRLSKYEMSSGTVDWVEPENIYAFVSGRVEEVLVKEGDTVSKDQPLMRFDFDKDETERKLKEIDGSRTKINADIQKIKVNIQNTKLKLEKTARYIDELENEVYEQEDVSTYELGALELEIDKAEKDLQNAELLYELGESSAQEVDKAQESLQALILKKENLESTISNQGEDNRKSVEEQEKSRATKLHDYETDIAAYSLELESLELDLRSKDTELDSLSLQEETYQKALEKFDENTVILAPVDGVVTTLDVSKGEQINENHLIASIGVKGAFSVSCNISLENNFVMPGDVCELSNSSHVLEGVVDKVEPVSNGKTVSVALVSDEVTAGETFDIVFEKESETTYTLVPNGALNQDNDGYYLNQIKRRDGILGEEYYLERLDVYIGDSDLKNTVIVKGITFFEPVALISDKPVGPGDIVSLKNAGDFFEN